MCSMSNPPRSPHLEAICRQAIASYTPKFGDSPVKTPKFERLLLSMLDTSEKFLGKTVSAHIFSAGMRSVVVRVSGECAGPCSHTLSCSDVVVKHFRRKDSATNSGGFGYLREKHGLDSLNALVGGSYSRLLGCDDDARFLVLEYIAGTPLNDFLEVDTPAGALSVDARARISETLGLWSSFWVTQLNSSWQPTVQESFRRGLLAADAGARYPGQLTSPQLAFKGLEKLVEAWDHTVDGDCHHQLHSQLSSIIFPEPKHSVLSSADFSPHNLIVIPVTDDLVVRGIDAEGSAIHHWALPVAEMLLGFPSHPASAYAPFIDTPTWRNACDNFYRQVYRGEPYETAADDPRVQAAILAVRCTLAEQTGNLAF